ncbi:MAG: hypothetical protein ACK4RT_00480 [Erythrobacter sp.]
MDSSPQPGGTLQPTKTLAIVTADPAAANRAMPLRHKPCESESKSMMIKTKTTFAATAAMLALSSAAAVAADAPAGSRGLAINAEDTVHCYGVHSCKGNADCATTENACKGQNACKGHGFKAMKAGECLTKGGTIGDLEA